ncbi:SDR family oxidoreductase [Bryobacter aggregatus]|uniref:SDR family oxidoreductase n=1 Tax=Bryobacter aggregatus TaxID=360054 RepID=UPI0004E0B239|nr:SDR family oxidoreductase [Bryobacter aggregatus]
MSTQKLALITGANKGIGLETAKQLAALGYTVIVGARKEAEGKAAAAEVGHGAQYLHIDMDQPATFAAAAKWIEEKFGKLDVLVNNAGIAGNLGVPPSHEALATVRHVFDVNVFALLELTQALLPLLRKSEQGRIVNVSSILGSLTLNANFDAPLGNWRSFSYNGSKAALNMLTATLAYELRDTPIKVNSVHPGWVKTDLGGAEAPLEVGEGAKTSVRLATIGSDGPTGAFFHLEETLAW